MEPPPDLWSPDMDWEPELSQNREQNLMDYKMEVSEGVSHRSSSGVSLPAPATSRQGNSDPASSVAGVANTARTSKLAQELSVSDIDPPTTPTTPTMTRTTTTTDSEEAITPITANVPSPRSRPVVLDFLDDTEPTRIHLAEILPGINTALAVLDFPATRPRLRRDSHTVPRPDVSDFLLDAGRGCVGKGPALDDVVEESIQEAVGELVEDVDQLLEHLKSRRGRGSEDVLGLGIMYNGRGKEMVDPLMADLDQMGKELWEEANKVRKK